MTDSIALAIASLCLLAVFVVSQVLRRWPLWARGSWLGGSLAILTALVHLVLGSPLSPRFHFESAGTLLWEQMVEAGWWVVAARSAIMLMRVFVVLDTRPRETRFVSDLLAAAVYLVMVMAIVNFVFQVPIGGLLATSGVIAIVLGLALQSTLADVFSGIAVGIERPYKPGDLLWVEGGVEGVVVEINWRSTQIATFRNDVAIIPNSVMAKARLVNHSMPTQTRRDTASIRVDPRPPPERSIAVIAAAVKACTHILDMPPAVIARTRLEGDGAIYEISYSVAHSRDLVDAKTELLGLLQRHLHHAGIPLAVAGLTDIADQSAPTVAMLLGQSDLFGVLEPRERDVLANSLVPVRFAMGETIIEQDESTEALFIIASGAVEITQTSATGRRVLRRMSPGGSLGVVSLITGAPSAVTAKALTPVRVYRLDKPSIAEAIAQHPDLATSLEALAARGNNTIDDDANGNDVFVEPKDLRSKFRSFLTKLSA